MIRVYYSPDLLMSRSVADKVIAKTFPERDEYNYASFNMGNSLIKDLAAECSFLPLGTERKCVLASDCAFLAKSTPAYKPRKGDEIDSLIEYLSHPDERIDLIMLVKADTVDEKSKAVKAILGSGGVIKGIPIPSQGEWVDYATKRLAGARVEIEPEAARELVYRCDSDYGRFMGELDKIISYSDGKTITLSDIEILVSPRIEEDNFVLSNAIVAGKTGESLSIYYDLKAHSAKEMTLINLLAGQFAFMDQVQYLNLKGYENHEIAKELNCSIGRVNANLRNLGKVRQGAIAKAMGRLYSCQKDILTGRASPEFAFTRFLTTVKIGK